MRVGNIVTQREKERKLGGIFCMFTVDTSELNSQTDPYTRI